MRPILILAAFLAAMTGFRPATAAEPPLTDAQKSEVEKIVGDYLKAHPEYVIDAIKTLQAREKARHEAAVQNELIASKDEIERDPAAPVAGNAGGDVTVVEFFDYRCGYCKQVFPAVRRILSTDTRLRYVFKEFPILTPESHVAARAALAAWKLAPDKYLAFHTALMSAKGSLPERQILAIAKSVGLDPAAIKGAMDDPDIADTLNRNHALAQRLGITGTPAFVIGGKLVPGAVPLDELQRLIKEARQG